MVSLLRRYGLAVLAVSASTAFALALRPDTYSTPYLIFYPAVLVAVWFGRLGPGLLATVLSAVSVDYFLTPPFGRVLTTKLDVLRAAFFCVSFGLICWMIEHRRHRSESLIDRQLQLLEMSHDPIIVRDSRDRIIYWNQGAERLYGWTKAEALGQVTHTLLRTVFPEPYEHIGADLNRHGRWEGELVHTRKNGTTVIVASRWTLQRKNTLQAAVLEANFDLTQLKEKESAQEALFRSEKLASAGRLAATIAHEINSPLAAVTNLLFIVAADASLPQHLRDHLDKADAELERIGQISKQTLGFYRENTTPVEIAAAALLDDVLVLLAKRLERKQIRIEKQYGDHARVAGQLGELRQVFSNLVANSIDALPLGGTIKIRASTVESYSDGRTRVRITIADNGPGIAPEARPHIFEPFFTTKQDSGTGLGLWVSKQIVDKHDGSIQVRSSYGGENRGTVFSVTLPAGRGMKTKEKAAS